MAAAARALTIAAALIAFGLLLWSISPLPDIRPPRSVNLPFNSLIEPRQFMLAQAGNSAPILIAGGTLALAAVWGLALRGRRLRQAASASIAIVCALTALQAQTLIMRGEREPGVLLYVLAGAAFGAWALANRQARADQEVQPQAASFDYAAKRLPLRSGCLRGRLSLSHRTEIVLLTLVLAVTVFGRIYDLKRLPYGIDGDESKWTIEVVSVMVDGHDALASEYHRRYLPMSFWMQAPFQWIMGAGLTPGRVEVAVFSVIASFVFYRLARELFDMPAALVATLLLAVSLPDLTASRAGNVESHVKLWAILPFYGLAVALRTRRLHHFLLTGCAVAGAMLTYETLMPTVAATLTLVLAAALRERREWKTWLRRLAMLATPPAVVAFVTIDYLLGRLQYYQGFRSQAEVYSFGEQLQRGIQGLLQPFFATPTFDALYHREGPIINGLLAPLLVLGIVYAIVHARQKGSAFVLTWLACAFIPIPIILHTPLPRVLYPGVPVLYLFIGLALMAVYRAVVRATQLPRTAAAIGIVSLGGFVMLNLTIWFQEMIDPIDELRRREVAEVVAASVDPHGPLLMLHYPLGETVDVEQELIALTIRDRRRTPQAGEYRLTLFNDLLPALSREGMSYGPIKVLYDTTRPVLFDERQRIIDAFRRCYPSARITRTTYFDVYHLGETDLSNPICRSAYLRATPPAQPLSSATPVIIRWSLDPTPASQADLECWRDQPDILWIEGESFDSRVGWSADVRFVTGWSGDGYLADDRGSQYAAATIDVPRAGVYRVWIRAYRRQADDFPAFMAIDRQLFAVGADRFPLGIGATRQRFPFGEADDGALNAWRWQPVADLSLETGPLTIGLTRPFDESRNRFIALFVDAIALSADPDFDPRRDERWQPALQLRGPGGGEQTGGAFEAQLDPGSYRCQVTVRDGEKLVDETGVVGIASDPVYFEVTP